MITEEELLKRGYREFETDKRIYVFSNRFFQKRFRNEKGATRYFIAFYEKSYPGEDGLTYDVNLSFEKDKYSMRIEIFGINKNMSVEEIEKEVYAIWYGLDCKYYDSEY